MEIRALVFDVDGTIADTEEAHRQAFNAAFAEHDLDWHWSRARYAELLGASGGRERMLLHIDSLPVPSAAREALRRRVPAIHRSKVRAYQALVETGRVPARFGVRRLIEEARREGIRLAVATTGTAAGVEALLLGAIGAQAREAFTVFAAGDLVANKKPAPDIYRLVLQQLNEPAGACVAFEDSANGVRAAHAAGLFVVATPTFWTLDQDFSDADLAVPTLGDPDQPIPPAIAAKRTGGVSYVNLALLRRLLAARVPSDQSA